MATFLEVSFSTISLNSSCKCPEWTLWETDTWASNKEKRKEKDREWRRERRQRKRKGREGKRGSREREERKVNYGCSGRTEPSSGGFNTSTR